jgi:uncharacterized protein
MRASFRKAASRGSNRPFVMPLISITANDIGDATGLVVDQDLPRAWLDEELGDAQATALAPGHVKARLSRTGDQIVVRGEVKAGVELPCARCLDPARYDVEGELSLLLTPAPVAAAAKAHVAKGHAAKANGKATHHFEPEEVELSSEDVERDTFDGETIVLDAFIREAILLELPNFPLCSEACPGIRPGPAESAPEAERVDPRLAPLGALRARLAEAKAKAGDERGEAKSSRTARTTKAPSKAPTKKKKAKE